MGIESNYLAWLEQELTKRSSVHSSAVPLGFGDDAAIIATSERTVCCTDLLAEGTHFVIESEADLARVGRKALAVNLSDMAAMGARPETALLSLLVNRQSGLLQATEVTRGLLELADEFDVTLVGGDTCSWQGKLVVNVSVNGRLLQDRPLLRSGAQPGDLIFVTGSLGGSILHKHWAFTPRCREIAAILESCRLHAATDLSDGLVRDLGNILAASQVGATLWGDAIPVSKAAYEVAAAPAPIDPTSIPPWTDGPKFSSAWYHALYDGEDFELLLVIPPDQTKHLDLLIESGLDGHDFSLTRIGQIDQQPGLRLLHQEKSWVVPPGGYCH